MKGTSMSTLADYLAFAKAHPALFANPPEGGIAILLNEDEIREAEAKMAQLYTGPRNLDTERG